MRDFSNNSNGLFLASVKLTDLLNKKEVETDNRILKRMAETIADEKTIMDEIRLVGIKACMIADFVNTAQSYPEALPILYKHLQVEGYALRKYEFLMRALTVKEAKGIGLAPFAKRYLDALSVQKYDTMDVAARAMAILGVKGENEIVRPLLGSTKQLTRADISHKVHEDIEKTLYRAYTRTGGK